MPRGIDLYPTECGRDYQTSEQLQTISEEILLQHCIKGYFYLKIVIEKYHK